MLGAPPLETTNNKKPSSPSSLLFAFVPRQVTLAKHQNMAKKEELVVSKTPTVESTKKDKSKKDKKKKKNKEGSDPSPLLLSIASYLQKQGFTNTVTALQSEASIGQIDDSKEHDLEMLFYKYLEASTSITKSNKNVPEELGLPNAGVIKEDQEKGKSTAETASTDNTAPGSQSHESEGKSKDKKRKKDKVTVENSGSETCTLEGKLVAKKSSTNIQLDEENIKHKNKKKKNKSSEPVLKPDRKEVDQVELCKTDSIKESKLALEITTDIIDKKSSKKRKRMVSEVNESQSDVNIKTNGPGKENVGTLEDDTVSKDKKSSKKQKKMITEGNDFKLDGDEKKAGSPSLDDVVQENGFVEDRNTDRRSEIPFKGVFHANGDVENGRAGAGSQKSMKKQQNGSSEPKTAFQRVKVDEVKFADDRLQDNSYWAKSGADIGYGAKAQEVLGQVRGRDFRHEKTKKKRGSYRGGQIDLQTHSIKFNYSDEE